MPQDRNQTGPSSGDVVTTHVPGRLERLPWGRFHTLVVVALGVTWILDGLEVTLAGSVAGALKASPALRLTDTQVGLAGSCYLAGAVSGALFFGWLADRLGRKKLFFITLAIYLVATALTAFSWNAASFFLFRFLTGAGIGGEYTAINSTIQEFVPARYRGWTDLVINGSFWVGAALGAGGSILLLDPAIIAPDLGWRVAFFIGAALGLLILFMRLWLPESPRWLVIHGREAQAEAIVGEIEADFKRRGYKLSEPSHVPMHVVPRTHTPLLEVATSLLKTHRRRTILGLALMIAQAFFYNAIFFTYALVLTRFQGVPSESVGWYILPFAAGNVLGPILLGRFFDTLGRRIMITATYALSGILLTIVGLLFARGDIGAVGMTAGWTLVFFFASPAASAAYLTVSESFPLEVRALAIAIFYAIGTAFGGIGAPYLLGLLIETGDRTSVFYGYLAGAVLMLGAAVVAWFLAHAAERKSLEEVASPLSSRNRHSAELAPPTV